MSTILVTGASGFVGSNVVPALLSRGHRVAALVRTPEAGAQLLDRLPAGQRAAVELRIGDVTRPGTLPAAMTGIDAVIHLVAIPSDRDGGRSLTRVNLDGTRNVLEAVEAAGIRRFVHQGALGVVDDPALHYASTKAQAEALVAASGLEWTILKPSLMWGPGDGFFNVIAGLARWSPVVPVPGRGESRFQPLAVADLARIVAQAVDDPATIRRTYELGGPRVWTYREIAAEVLEGMGARRLILPLPVPLIRLVAATSETLRLPFPVATDQLRQLGFDNVGPIDGVRSAFGFEPADMAGQLGYLRERSGRQAVGSGTGATAPSAAIDGSSGTADSPPVAPRQGSSRA